MNRRFRLRAPLLVATLALVVSSVTTAQSTNEGTPSTATTAVATPAATRDDAVPSKSGTLALPANPATRMPATQMPDAAETTAPSAIAALDPMAPIGSTTVVRSDNSSVAFEQLAHGHAFLSRADVDALPSFGDAFAKADRDGDGRLDRTEFVDAWSYYAAPSAPPGATDMPAMASGEATAGARTQADGTASK